MKRCKECKTDLVGGNYIEGQYKNGFFMCKSCYREYQKQRRTKKQMQVHNAKPKSRFCRLKASTKRRGHEVSLTFEDFEKLMDKPCVYCQNKLAGVSLQGSNIDRIDNTKGYTVDNVQPCCKICNNMRSTFLTVDETHVVVSALINYRDL